ncbi:hypothetical protein C9181_26375, partial (plasmid) [Escherichia coli]
MLPSETMIWQPEFTDKTLSRKPGAVHSGEFCRGMTLFMSYFSRSTRTVYGYRYSDLNARILPRQ